MIYDRLNNAEQYFALSKNIQKGFEFLLNNDLANMQDGKHIIKGDEIYANIQTLTTKPIEEAKWEAHRKYIDIQYVIKGYEKMGYGVLQDFKKVAIPYNDEKDVIFLEDGNYNYVDVQNGDFVIFYPNDVHAPMLNYKEPMKIKKVIVKVKL